MNQSIDALDPVDLGAPPGTVRGCTGLWVESRHVYCVWIEDAQRSYLTILERPALMPVHVGPLEHVHDPHSIAVVDGWIYVAATGSDEVRRVQLARPDDSSEVVWRASGAGIDTHHVNSILPVEQGLLCSAFGPKTGERWSTAVSGYVAEIASGEILWQEIQHPHSLALGPDDIYVAESRRARVRGLRGGRMATVDGYARGLAFAPGGLMAAGSSRGRARSRSLGTIENPADAGEWSGDVGVTFFAADAGAFSPMAVRTLSNLEAEIYDVAILT